MVHCVYAERKKNSTRSDGGIDLASEKAVTFQKNTYPEQEPFKASTLASDYRKEMQKTGLANEYFKEWAFFEKVDKNYKKETEKFINLIERAGEP